MSSISIIGDGGWGTALSLVLERAGKNPLLWSYSPEYADFLVRQRENVKFLKGIRLPETLRVTSDVSGVKKSAFAVFAVPCEHLRHVAGVFAGSGFEYIISGTKGIENRSLKRPTEILEEYFPKAKIGVISGPSIAYEVAKNFPTTVVFAADDGWNRIVQETMATEAFRVYTSGDKIGVELGGALKNIIAIAAGISDGLGFGANSKAAILTRGLAEITRLGVKMGAGKDTFSGLSGIGDLATTCMSEKSRNRWFGEELGKGRKKEDILSETEMVVEGIGTCVSAKALAEKYDVEMPITQKIYEIVHDGKDPREAVRELMTRGLKQED